MKDKQKRPYASNLRREQKKGHKRKKEINHMIANGNNYYMAQLLYLLKFAVTQLVATLII